MLKNPTMTWKSPLWDKLIGHFSPIAPPFAARGLSRHPTWIVPGDERGKLKKGSTISLGRLQYIWRVNHRPHEGGGGEEEEEEEVVVVVVMIREFFQSLYVTAEI
jgi:hypothetical protein